MDDSDLTMLEVGSQAPDFTVTLGSGERFTLSEHRGRNVVLFFYPRAFTHGCTVEVGGFCESYEDLTPTTPSSSASALTA